VSRRTFAGFSRRVVKAAGENWDDVKSFNSALRRLEKRRATKVKKEGPLAESKIAWKIAVLQQALLYRIIELGGGCATMWNMGNVLCSVLAARALLETIALTADFEAKLQKHYKANDFEALDNLVTSLTFATRDPDALSETPELAAKNVLTYIDRLSAKFPLLRKHYDNLSEWCHPNSYGHFFTFGSLDTDTGTVSFSKRKLHTKGMLDHILAVYLMIGLIVDLMNRLDILIQDIAKAHFAAS